MHCIKETLEAAVLDVIADGNELDGNASGDPDRVLDVEVLNSSMLT